jgi:tRNA U34 5-methylaminomethyl-2-thiouridine-forming methyltransferase MnmC
MSQLLKHYSLLETEDGSQTLFSETFQEACHSTSGARAETKLHYLEGCHVEQKARSKPTTILEVGFGTGLGFLMTAELLSSIPGEHRYVTLEIDPHLVRWFLEMHPEIEHEWIDENNFPFVRGCWKNTQLFIVLGNARSSLPHFLKNHKFVFDAIYQDAFSPKRNPVLWTREWFTLLKENSAPDVILSTYSASNSIRKSLQEAGWTVQNGEKFGPKRSSTRARLEGETAPEILEVMKRSPSKPILDADLSPELFK